VIDAKCLISLQNKCPVQEEQTSRLASRIGFQNLTASRNGSRWMAYFVRTNIYIYIYEM